MPTETAPILVISFRTPPYAGVGARRWTKLARYLAEGGREVHLLTVRWLPHDTEALRELDHPRITIHRIPSLGPHLLDTRRPAPGVRGLALIAWRKLALPVFRLLGLDEDARWWGLVMLPAARRLIRRHGIRCVVATGPPFHVNWWAAKLRDTEPDIRLVQDLRDPWASLPASTHDAIRRRGVERTRAMQSAALDRADLVVTVSEGCRRLLAADTVTPVSIIPNGYDPADLPALPSGGERPFSIAYAGTFGGGRRRPMLAFLAVVEELADDIPDIRLDFWSPRDPEILAAASNLVESGIARFHEMGPSAEVMQRIAQHSFACLHVAALERPDGLSMKIFEYAQTRRPVLSISYGGEIADFVREHHLGMDIPGDDRRATEEAIRQLHTMWREDPNSLTRPVGFDRFDYRSLASEWLTLCDPAGSSRST